MSQRLDTPHGHRFPTEIISHAVWLHYVFSPSPQDVELLLAEQGVIVSYKTIRRWCLRFSQEVADRLRRRRLKPGDTWRLDQIFILSTNFQVANRDARSFHEPAPDADRRDPRDLTEPIRRSQGEDTVSKASESEVTASLQNWRVVLDHDLDDPTQDAAATKAATVELDIAGGRDF